MNYLTIIVVIFCFSISSYVILELTKKNKKHIEYKNKLIASIHEDNISLNKKIIDITDELQKCSSKLQNMTRASYILGSSLDRVETTYNEKSRLDYIHINKLYRQRNILVALLAQIYPSGIKRTENEGSDLDRFNYVFIELPDGSQCSWRYTDSESYLFENLPLYEKEWDGHSTENKYFNIEELIASESLLRKNILK